MQKKNNLWNPFFKSFFFLWRHPSKLYHRRSGKLLLLREWWCLPFSFVWVFGWQARSVLRVQLITCVPIAWHCLPLPAVTCSNTMHRRTNKLHNTSSIRSCSRGHTIQLQARLTSAFTSSQVWPSQVTLAIGHMGKFWWNSMKAGVGNASFCCPHCHSLE